MQPEVVFLRCEAILKPDGDLGWTKGALVAGTGKKWLLGCGLGCGIPILLSIILSVGGSIMMMKPFDRAVDAQKKLTSSFGAREDFVPTVDSLTPDRLEAFLAVRRSLVPMCEGFAEIGQKFERLEELDNQGEEPSKGELFGAVGDMMGAAFGIAGNIGRFTEARNEALLAENMGLGEYIWIYTLAYNSWLQYPPNTDFSDGEGSGEYGRADQKIIRQLMANHAEALLAAGRAAEAEAWEGEADFLERREGSGVPWLENELPAGVANALEPYRDDLDGLYCAASSAFEFSQLKKKGLTISSD